VKLAGAGVNTLQSVRSNARVGLKPRTLAAGNASNADWRYLAARRLTLFILNSIERATTWPSAAQSPAVTPESAAVQVRRFFEVLCESGTFGERRAEEAFFVIDDDRVKFQLVVGFAASREHEFHCFRILPTAQGINIQSVRINRFNLSQFSPAELEWVDGIASQLKS
jgi:uncharacterized protein